jgi:hypothetical protein
MQDAIALFAIRLICGMNVMLCLMPRKDVATAFFRIMMLVTLGLAVLLALVAPSEVWVGVGLGILAFLGSNFWLLERRSAGTAAIVLVALVAVVELGRLSVASPALDTAGKMALSLASGMAAAGTLGAAMTGMLLGHRYLTAPGMPLAPLLRLNAMLAIAVLGRLIVSGCGLASGYTDLNDSSYWIWLALRWLAGIAGPALAWWMVVRILKYRNTQAATGVLFVAVILTFIGELTADLLLKAVGIAF